MTIGAAVNNLKNNDFEAAYDEVLAGLPGSSNVIKLRNAKSGAEVKIPKETLRKLYEGLGLKKRVLKKLIKAHTIVLQHGLSTGNERVLAIDSKTGRVEADKTGTPYRVEWSLSPKYSGKVVTVHNHPSSSPFSAVDLYYFGISPHTLCMAVQGHNGNTYSLIKTTADAKFNHTEDSLGALFEIVKANPAYKGKSYVEKGEIFVEQLARHMKWEFRKGDVENA